MIKNERFLLALCWLAIGCVLCGLSSEAKAQSQLNGIVGCHGGGRSPFDNRVAVTIPPLRTSTIRTGDPITVSWAFTPHPDQSCPSPLYLILFTSSPVRFEGDNIFAMLPGPLGPFYIYYARQKTRVFIPLHIDPRFFSGSFTVKVYASGPFSMDWALVEVPTRQDWLARETDLQIGQTRELARGTAIRDFPIVGGNPKIVIRDDFSNEQPKSLLVSNSGEFELQIFDKFYRVFDRNTSELILERGGWDPNFSRRADFWERIPRAQASKLSIYIREQL